MTVCIAAVCELNSDDPKIVICTDSQVGGSLGTADTMLKIRTITPVWRCLTAGTDTDILGLLRLVRLHFARAKGEIDETTVLSIVRAALSARKAEKVDELIQGRFAIPYSEFLAHGKERLPEESFRSAVTETELTEINAEFLIVGFWRQFATLIKTDHKCGAMLQEDFSVAGEGAYLAQASLLDREHHGMKSFGETIYSVYEAKKFAQGAPSVGEDTRLSVLHKTGEWELLSLKGHDFMETARQELDRKPIPKLTLKSEFFHKMESWSTTD
jgi:hypothetical protein